MQRFSRNNIKWDQKKLGKTHQCASQKSLKRIQSSYLARSNRVRYLHICHIFEQIFKTKSIIQNVIRRNWVKTHKCASQKSLKRIQSSYLARGNWVRCLDIFCHIFPFRADFSPIIGHSKWLTAKKNGICLFFNPLTFPT